MALPNPNLGAPNSLLAPRGGGARSRGVLPNVCNFGPKADIFHRKRPQNGVKTAKQRQAVAILQVHLNCCMTESPSVPCSPTICPRNVPKLAKNGLNVRCLCQTPRKPRMGRIFGYVAQGHLVHPQFPTFCGFQAPILPNESRRPLYECLLGGAGGQLGPRTAGSKGGCASIPRVKKIIFSKVVPRPFGMPKEVVSVRFQPVVARFADRKSQSDM